MRILYIDIDSLHPDHLGCYGYSRNTSPNIDRIATEGIRLDNCYVSDAPCLPSRTALFSGRCGFHTGVVGHGGTAADPFIEGTTRGFTSQWGRTSWISCLREAGMKTASISPFATRHSAWWWCAGFREIIDPGGNGQTTRADQVCDLAIDWLARNGARDQWFLHINLWDAHVPYRAPASFGEPFIDDPLPAWYTDEVHHRNVRGYGPNSARDGIAWSRPDGQPHPYEKSYPRQPVVFDSMGEIRRMFDGYDTGIRFADEQLGRVFAKLADLRVLDDTAIIISADHGESLGELNIYCDHKLADHVTTRVPLILRWPGVVADSQRAYTAFHYQYDVAATVLELAGGQVPDNWDGRSFASSLRAGNDSGREFLVVGAGAHTCARGVRFRSDGREYMATRTYHDGYCNLPPRMLFDVSANPHEERNLVDGCAELWDQAMGLYETWYAEMIRTGHHDPLMTVMQEGGPFHSRGALPGLLSRLEREGRTEAVERLRTSHADECRSLEP